MLASTLALTAGCGSSPAASAPAALATPARWHQLGTWSGRGNRQTESFDVTSGSLRVTWEATNETAPGAGRLRVALCSAISGRELQTVLEHRGAGSATVNIGDDPRVSYLLIESDAVDWRITIDELAP